MNIHRIFAPIRGGLKIAGAVISGEIFVVAGCETGSPVHGIRRHFLRKLLGLFAGLSRASAVSVRSGADDGWWRGGSIAISYRRKETSVPLLDTWLRLQWVKPRAE
jgi:hypothetical protein